jgi:hypothetical protein
MVGILLDNDLSGMLDLLDSALQRSGWAVCNYYSSLPYHKPVLHTMPLIGRVGELLRPGNDPADWQSQPQRS